MRVAPIDISVWTYLGLTQSAFSGRFTQRAPGDFVPPRIYPCGPLAARKRRFWGGRAPAGRLLEPHHRVSRIIVAHYAAGDRLPKRRRTAPAGSGQPQSATLLRRR